MDISTLVYVIMLTFSLLTLFYAGYIQVWFTKWDSQQNPPSWLGWKVRFDIHVHVLVACFLGFKLSAVFYAIYAYYVSACLTY